MKNNNRKSENKFKKKIKRGNKSKKETGLMILSANAAKIKGKC